MENQMNLSAVQGIFRHFQRDLTDSLSQLLFGYDWQVNYSIKILLLCRV